MDKKLKAKWVKALRSGEWKQTTDRYQRDDSFCCLGVLACLKAGKRLDDYECEKMWRGGGYLDKAIPDDKSDKLITMNDSGKSFKVIATYIEKHL
jgi:hypothetical protein